MSFIRCVAIVLIILNSNIDVLFYNFEFDSYNTNNSEKIYYLYLLILLETTEIIKYHLCNDHMLK